MFVERNQVKVSMVPLTLKISIPAFLVWDAKPWMRFQFDQMLDRFNILSLYNDIIITSDLHDEESWEEEGTMVLLIKNAIDQDSSMIVEFVKDDKRLIQFNPLDIGENLLQMSQKSAANVAIF